MSKRKLLLADDSITIQKVVNLTFADEGIEVISVGDGDSAMRKFDEFMPDLVMADVNMPGINGYEICRIIKQTDETRNIPVILLVGSFEPFDEAEAKEVGADDFLTKPFQSIRQLVNKVTDLLNQRERDSVETESAAPDGFADTLEFEKMQEGASELGDSGMDDEMIETSPANDLVAESESAEQAETPVDHAKTQPLNAEDLKGFDIVSGAAPEPAETPEAVENQEFAAETDEPAETNPPPSFEEEASKFEETLRFEPPVAENLSETEPEIDYYLPAGEEFEKEVSDAETLEPEISYAPEEPRTADFSEATAEEPDETEEVTETLDEIPEAEEKAETETDFTEEPEAETTPEAEAKPEAEAATENETEETPQAEMADAAPETVPSLNFDDGDLLELPPLVEETGIRPPPKAQPLVSETEPAAEIPSEPEAEETSEPPPAAELNTAQAFPPELIEAIAQRVAEQISAKTLSDVLPQITELVMKKMAEEKKK